MMHTVKSRPDQWTAIGEALAFAPTDIDSGGVRIMVRGEVVGGPEDGGRIDRAFEIATGRSVAIGLVTIGVISVTIRTAKFGVIVPPHIAVVTKEKDE